MRINTHEKATKIRILLSKALINADFPTLADPYKNKDYTYNQDQTHITY